MLQLLCRKGLDRATVHPPGSVRDAPSWVHNPGDAGTGKFCAREKSKIYPETGEEPKNNKALPTWKKGQKKWGSPTGMSTQ